jgi:hypothetical protein
VFKDLAVLARPSGAAVYVTPYRDGPASADAIRAKLAEATRA